MATYQFKQLKQELRDQHGRVEGLFRISFKVAANTFPPLWKIRAQLKRTPNDDMLIHREFDRPTWEQACKLAQKGEIEAAVLRTEEASNVKMQDQMRRGLDSIIFKWAVRTGRRYSENSLARAIALTEFASSDFSRERMRSGLDLFVWKRVVRDKVRNRDETSSLQLASSPELQQRMQQVLHRTPVSTISLWSDRALPSDSDTRVDALKRSVRNSQIRKVLSQYNDTLLLTLDEYFGDLELRALLSGEKVTFQKQVSLTSEVMTRHGITATDETAQQLATALAEARLRVVDQAKTTDISFF